VERGLPFTVATARTLPSALHGLGPVLPRLPLIVNNGALVIEPQGRILHEAAMDAALGGHILQFLKTLELPLVAVPSASASHNRYWWKRPGPSSMDLLLKSHGGQPDLLPLPEHGLPAEQAWSSISCSGHFEIMKPVLAFAHGLPGAQVDIMQDPYQQEVQVVFFQHASANKGSALRWLCDHLGMPCTDATAFGDGLNDLSLFESAGYGVAVDGSGEALRSLADLCLKPGESVLDYLEARWGR
jgi:hydroxymethylpyrimidine pyrophosphatase-like HAD family hydrolase